MQLLGPCQPEWPVMIPMAMGSSGAGMITRVLSRFMTSLQPEFKFVSMAHVTTKGSADAQGLGPHLMLCCCLSIMLPSRPYRSKCSVFLPGNMLRFKLKL